MFVLFGIFDVIFVIAAFKSVLVVKPEISGNAYKITSVPFSISAFIANPVN